jgi:hypothetical protein
LLAGRAALLFGLSAATKSLSLNGHRTSLFGINDLTPSPKRFTIMATSSKRKVDEISRGDDSSNTPEEDKKEEPEEDKKEEDKKEDDEEVVAAAAEQATEKVAKAVNDDDEDNEALTPSGKRRFFPRVKHLLAIEWEQVSEMELRWNGME